LTSRSIGIERNARLVNVMLRATCAWKRAAPVAGAAEKAKARMLFPEPSSLKWSGRDLIAPTPGCREWSLEYW
jgi:hypothetical protein